jgi:hypothetical protein
VPPIISISHTGQIWSGGLRANLAPVPAAVRLAVAVEGAASIGLAGLLALGVEPASSGLERLS